MAKMWPNVEAVKWYHKAVEQNYAEAQYNLGDCYVHGEAWRRMRSRRSSGIANPPSRVTPMLKRRKQ